MEQTTQAHLLLKTTHSEKCHYSIFLALAVTRIAKHTVEFFRPETENILHLRKCVKRVLARLISQPICNRIRRSLEIL